MTEEGDLITWGHNKNGGGLGRGKDADYAPHFVTDLKGKKNQTVACGHNITAVITGTNNVVTSYTK
jgi:hypothetical protein